MPFVLSLELICLDWSCRVDVSPIVSPPARAAPNRFRADVANSLYRPPSGYDVSSWDGGNDPRGSSRTTSR
jgi:hypothetical protein